MLLNVDQLHDRTQDQALTKRGGGGRPRADAGGRDADQHQEDRSPQRLRQRMSRLQSCSHLAGPLIAPAGLGLGFGRVMRGLSGADWMVVVQFKVVWQLS